VVDLPLLRRIGETRKPVIMSTGMASLPEIEEAVSTLRQAGTRELALLKCTSAYPAPPEEMNLRTIPDLARRFGVPAGLSDHSLDSAVAIAAVGLGACILEKHLTLSRAAPGPDSAFSMEPAEFKAMVQAVRTARASLGRVSYELTAKEASSRAFRRSLFAVRDIKQGESFTNQNVRCIRPAHGLHPRHLGEILGRKASHDIARGTPLSWDLIG
jgi:pseudaminic acid synthase